MVDRPYRIAIVARHPIQYQDGLWIRMAKHPKLDIHVIFLDTIGIDDTFDTTINAVVKWDTPLLEGYSWEFVPNISPARFTSVIDRINPGLPRALTKNKFDAVVVHGYLSISNWLLLITTSVNRIPLILRGEGSVRSVSSGFSCIFSFLRSPMQSFFLHCCDAIACSSTDNADYHRSRGADVKKLFSMPCSIDRVQLDKFKMQSRSRNDVRRAYGLPLDKILVLSVTRLNKYKRPLDTIEAFGRLTLSENINFHVVFVGDGPNRKFLENKSKKLGLSDQIHFLGFLNQSVLVEIILACDLFVLPSEVDPSPKALSEATYLGLPAICSDSVGTGPDFIEDGKTGRIFPTGNVGAYAQAIYDLVIDPVELKIMGRRSSKFARSNDFNIGIENFVKRMDKLIG